MLPLKQRHFTDPPGKVVKAKYPNDNYKTRISKQISSKLKGKKWWWEGASLYIKYYKDSDFKELKIMLLLISHDIRVDYPKVSRRFFKEMFYPKEIIEICNKIKV